MEGHITSRYKLLVGIGVEGDLEGSLQKVEKYLRGKEGFEVGFLKRKENIEFIAAFVSSPFIDLTFEQHGPTAYIAGYGLNNTQIMKMIKETVDATGISLHETIDPEFKRKLKSDIEIEKIPYDLCEDISQGLGYSMEKVLGSVHYANFLNKYNNVPDRRARERALSRFGLDPRLLL